MQTDLQAPVSAPTMARLLAGLLASPSSDVPPLPETLGQWIDWPRAVALSRALDTEQASGQPAVCDEAPMRDASTQLRAGLQAAIFDAQAWAAAAPLPLADPVAAFAPLHPRYSGDTERVMPHVLNIAFAGIDSEALIVALKDMIAISNGSACTSSSYTPSHVLKAMGFDDATANECVRLSWCHLTSEVDWQAIAEKCDNIPLRRFVAKIRHYSSRAV